jgi:hypothetical protein
VSWRWLLPFPCAALILGTPVVAPQLQEALPRLEDPICNYASATENYLLAYAYSRETPAHALALLESAEHERELCAGDSTSLATRIDALRKRLRSP